MSGSVNEDPVLGDKETSFWDVDGYKPTVKRNEDGHKLCSDLTLMLKDRAEIEHKYSKELKAWSKKWNDLITKGPEYGTTEGAWLASLAAADRMAEIHLQIREDLINDCNSMIKRWRTDNFHKPPVMGPTKETKELEEGFRKAQKPWAKRLAKVQKAKKDFQTACKLEKSATQQEINARADSSVSPDQRKKLQDKVEKCKKDVEVTREKYETALSDINAYNAKYMEDMTQVYEECQQAEEKRLVFFKDVWFQIHKKLDISVNTEIPDIYRDFYQTIEKADHQKDLKYWSVHHGIDMNMHWPVFEEYLPELGELGSKRKRGLDQTTTGITLRSIKHDKYHEEFPAESSLSESSPSPQPQPEYSPDFHSISRKDKKSAVSTGDGITLTKIKNNDNTAYRPATPEPQPPTNNYSYDPPPPPPAEPQQPLMTRQASYDPSLNPFGDDDDVQEPSPPRDGSQPKHGQPRNSAKNYEQNTNNFGADEWDDGEVDEYGPDGIPVRALYDYQGVDTDELTFMKGDVFSKLTNADEQGWCKGRIGNRTGLYPDGYVEVIS